jgi:hypothetical protein
MTYDTKCYDLAKAFLEDEPDLLCDEYIDELAKDIQTCIEDFIMFNKATSGNA